MKFKTRKIRLILLDLSFQAALIISSLPKSKKNKDKKARVVEEEVETTWFQSEIVRVIEELDIMNALKL